MLASSRLRLGFSDGTRRIVDFGPFLRQSRNPLIQAYLDPVAFARFTVRDGDLIWDDYDLCFPDCRSLRGTSVRADSLSSRRPGRDVFNDPLVFRFRREGQVCAAKCFPARRGNCPVVWSYTPYSLAVSTRAKRFSSGIWADRINPSGAFFWFREQKVAKLLLFDRSTGQRRGVPRPWAGRPCYEERVA